MMLFTMPVGTGAVAPIVHGTTAPYLARLPVDGNLFTITVEITADDGRAHDVTAVWSDFAGGLARIDGIGSLPPGRYEVRYRLVDAAGRIRFVPSGETPDRWEIVKP